jgi:hypothetical protein
MKVIPPLQKKVSRDIETVEIPGKNSKVHLLKWPVTTKRIQTNK